MKKTTWFCLLVCLCYGAPKHTGQSIGNDFLDSIDDHVGPQSSTKSTSCYFHDNKNATTLSKSKYTVCTWKNALDEAACELKYNFKTNRITAKCVRPYREKLTCKKECIISPRAEKHRWTGELLIHDISLQCCCTKMNCNENIHELIEADEKSLAEFNPIYNRTRLSSYSLALADPDNTDIKLRFRRRRDNH